MTAISVHHTDTNEDRAWDGPAEEAKLDTPITKSIGQGMYAWYDPKGTDDDGDGWPDVKSAYKFPHHFVENGKPGAASIKGVNNALARVSQADIPDAERPATEKHLNEHRADAGLEDWAAAPVRSRQPIRIVQGSAEPFTPFWRVRAATSQEPAQIDFFGEISEFSWFGDEITPQLFKADLAKLQGQPLTIRLHSGGGDVFAAAAIRAMLIDYPGRITVKVLGLAASAAVAIALVGDEVQIYDTAYMMIHNPGYLMLVGYITADLMRKWSAELDLFREGLINAYEARTGMKRDALGKMMDEETWMTAQQAVEMGFADKVITGETAPAGVSASALTGFQHVPAAVIQSVVSGQAPGPTHVSAAMRAHRDQLEAVKKKHEGVETMSSYLRKLLSERTELLGQAQAIVDQAEAEGRDLTEDEHGQLVDLVGEGETNGKVGDLDDRIEKNLAEREALRTKAEKKFALPGETPVKPEGEVKKVLKRAEYDKLPPAEQRAFITAGGKIED